MDFNALVREMRRVRTTEAMMVLYEHLLRLETWFFANEPGSPLGTPLQWRFPDGLNPTPCVLIYTDADRAMQRATEVAAPLGKQGEVVSLAVENAVAWLLSGDLGVTWASVNHGPGSENFPLYFDQLAELARRFGAGAKSGGYFPPDYKQFPFQEGDLLASQRTDGKFAISKVLKVDTIRLRAGDSISIQGQDFTAPTEDSLLVVSVALGAPEFDSLEEARRAAASGRWTTHVAHVPNRAPGAAAGKVRVGSAPVQEAELVGYVARGLRQGRSRDLLTRAYWSASISG